MGKNTRTQKQRKIKKIGGNPFRAIPRPLVGAPWGPEVREWPGVDGVDHNRNYYAQNMYLEDPQTAMRLSSGKLYGGKRVKTRKLIKTKKNKTKTKKCKKNGRKGGNIVPQVVVNMGRDVGHHVHSTVNALKGLPTPPNPLPYMDQLP